MSDAYCSPASLPDITSTDVRVLTVRTAWRATGAFVSDFPVNDHSPRTGRRHDSFGRWTQGLVRAQFAVPGWPLTDYVTFTDGTFSLAAYWATSDLYVYCIFER